LKLAAITLELALSTLDGGWVVWLEFHYLPSLRVDSVEASTTR